MVRGCKNNEICGRIILQYDCNSMSQIKVYEMASKIVNDACSGLLSTVACVYIKGQLDQRIWDIRRISIDLIAYK
jgi:hypothetical protein